MPPIPRDALSLLHRPPPHRVRKLVEELVRANQAAEAGENELYVALKCVVSLLHFLDDDLVIRATGLTRPLGRLAAALRDVGQGAQPAMFFERPNKGVGRPKDISFEVARGTIAAAVAVLVDNGASRMEAASFVAAELRKTDCKLPNGNPISSKQVLRWRDEMGGSAPALAEATYKDVLSKYARASTVAPLSPRRLRDIVRGSLQALVYSGF
jgi:hypothetical protein